VQNIAAIDDRCQETHELTLSLSGLSRAERRLLLRSSLQLLLNRMRNSIPVRRADLIRLADHVADDATEFAS
jgi:hypothetical protein